MKRVVPTETVMHLWANKAQSDARNSHGNVFFSGDIIYSYGHHFPMARHVTNDKGQTAILFTCRTYSVTTAKHLSELRRAIPASIPVFKCSNVTANLCNAQLAYYQDEIDEAVSKAEKSIKYKQHHIDRIPRLIEKFNQFARFMGLASQPKIPSPEWNEAQFAKIKKHEAKEQWRRDNPTQYQAKKQREQERREALRLKQTEFEREQQREQFKRWLAGESVAFPSHYREWNNDYLRIYQGEVQTSRQATVPLEHVVKVSALILNMIDSGRTYKRNGHTIHLGQYAIESLDENGTLTVGCHRFRAEEIFRFAAELNSYLGQIDTSPEIIAELIAEGN